MVNALVKAAARDKTDSQEVNPVSAKGSQSGGMRCFRMRRDVETKRCDCQRLKRELGGKDG